MQYNACIYRRSRGEKENMTKEKETENRSERERFLDRMLKEILSGQRKPGDRLPTESELAEQYGLRKTNVHLGLQELERLGFLRVVPGTRPMSRPTGSRQIWRRWPPS